MDNQSGQNNFELLPEYKQVSLCRETLALVRRIQFFQPELWAAIQAEAAKNEAQAAGGAQG